MGRLDIRICEARNLPDTQLISKPDPYCIVRCDNQQHKTRVMDNNLNPKWEEVFKFQIADEHSAQLRFELWNHNIVSDELLGVYTLSISGLKKGLVSDQWYLLQKCKGNAELRVRLCALDFGVEPTPEEKAQMALNGTQVGGPIASTIPSHKPGFPQQQQQGFQQPGFPAQRPGQQPGYPPQQPGYPPQQPGYPPQQPGYPPQQPGYPPQQPGYPPQQPGYPPQQPGYPPQQPGYPPQQPGYPPQQPGYPPQQPGYPPQQPGYPPQQPGYQQPGYPPQQPGYPPQQLGYPPQQPGYPPQQPNYGY